MSRLMVDCVASMPRYASRSRISCWLASPAGPDVVRMSPPLVATDGDVAEAAAAFGAAVASVLAPREEASA